MKNEFIVLLIYFFCIKYSITIDQKEREKLLKKHTKKLDKNYQTIFNSVKSFYHDESYLTYEPSKIKEIIEKYKFP